MSETMLSCPCKMCVTIRPEHKGLDWHPRIIICPRCAQKNCPHAFDHRAPCLGDVRG